MKKNRIAIFLNCLEPIFLSPENKRSCFVIVEKSSFYSSFARSNFSAAKLIFFSKRKRKNGQISFWEMLKEPDLINRLKQKKITHFVVPHRYYAKIGEWAKKNNIKLIGPVQSQQKYENKLFFDNFLKKNNISSPPMVDKRNLTAKKSPNTLVVQTEESFGLFGTKFIKGGESLSEIKINNKKLLIRKFLSGPSLGVSIFLNKKGYYFFSSLRRQCFIYNRNIPNKFLGIQWLPINFFSKKIRQKIANILSRLAMELGKSGFYGLANVDLIISKDEPYILECNPRLSSATPQIFSIEKLTNIKNPWNFYLDIFLKPQRTVRVKADKLPNSDYIGSILDIDVYEKAVIKKVLPIGIYLWKNNKTIFISNSTDAYQKNKNALFLFHELSGGETLNKNETLCTIFSHTPLFNLAAGSFNKEGIKIYNYLKKEFLEN